MNDTPRPWVLITGSAGAIGVALRSSFIDAGYNIIAADIKQGQEGLCAHTVAITIDLEVIIESEQQQKEFYSKVNKITDGRGVTALINNAAVQHLGTLKQLTKPQWGQSLNVNLSVPFFLIQAFMEDLENNSGAIVNISSIHARLSKSGFVAYATSKAALSALTKNVALEAGNKFRVNAIEPAAVNTEMLKAGFVDDEAGYKKLESFHPIGRVAEPKEISDLAVFLCSDKSQFIQGACIAATGGIDSCLSDPQINDKKEI